VMEQMNPKRVDYWEKWSGEEWEAMANIVRSFNDSQDKYEVVMTPTGDSSSSPDLPLFLNAQKQGRPPDLIGLEDHQITDLAAQKALIPLNGLIQSSEPSLSDYNDNFLELCTYAGKLYGVPSAADIVTLYVNLDMLKGTRFEAEMTADISEFDAGLDEFGKDNGIGFIPTYPGWWPHSWVWFFGGSWFDGKKSFVPALPANIRAYEWISSFRKRWNLNAFSETINPIGSRDPDPFLTGRVAMVLEGDWLIRRLLATPTLNWAPAPFPTIHGRPAALIVSDVLSIPKGARNPEGAAAFINFAIQSEQVEQLALGQGKISPLRHQSEYYISNHKNPHLQDLQKILLSAELFYDPRVPQWMSRLIQIKQAFLSIWSELTTPPQALNAINRAS